jgi:disulfide bond formation protein DsbB
VKKYIAYLPYAAFVIALVSTVVSLYLSEVAGLLPCKLCWEQRIVMYPLVIIFIVGILRKERDIQYYSLPFSIIGMLIALYQNLLIYKIIPENLAPCTAGVSCTQNQGDLFGFITIPMLSFIAFTFITICMIIYVKLKPELPSLTKTKKK